MQIKAQAFNMAYSGRTLVLKSEVQIYTPFEATSPPDPKDCKKYVAIWDMGATNTVITTKVVNECGLKPIGIAQVSTASGKTMANVYLASVWLPNKVHFSQVRVTEGTIEGDAEVLIGMDIIGTGDFAVTHKDGKTNFSFRYPSLECINFVKDQPLNIQSGSQSLRKVGRNELCPCGSGKKYKHCCVG